MSSLQGYLALGGRLLLSAIFLLSGSGKIMDWSGTAAHMRAEGMPLVPLLLVGAILFELVGGFSLLFAWKPKLGAWLLFLYLIPTTLIFHDFWAFGGAERMNQMIHFLKNLTIMGGLLIVASIPEREIKVRSGERVFDRNRFDRRRAA